MNSKALDHNLHPPARGAERRSAPRTPVILRVDYGSGADVPADYVTDLAEGGLFIRTERAFAVGEHLVLALSFPGLLEPCRVECVVRWRREKPSSHAPLAVGVGVEFADWAPSEKRRIMQLLSLLRAQALYPVKPPHITLPRVLLVEDNPFVSDLFQFAVLRFQRELGEERPDLILVARTAPEALRLIEGAPPDLILADHFMPGPSGCDLVRHLRATSQFANTPILVISVGGEEVRREALTAGATIYMDKPVLLTRLTDTLRALMCTQAVLP